MTTDDLESWVECLRRRRYADLSTAVWDLLWLAAQHRRFTMKPKAGIGLEFFLGDQEPRFYALRDAGGWFRAILTRMAVLLGERGAIAEGTGQYGFEARIRMPDEAGVDRAFGIETKNNQRDGFSLIVRRQEDGGQPAHGANVSEDSPPPA